MAKDKSNELQWKRRIVFLWGRLLYLHSTCLLFYSCRLCISRIFQPIDRDQTIQMYSSSIELVPKLTQLENFSIVLSQLPHAYLRSIRGSCLLSSPLARTLLLPPSPIRVFNHFILRTINLCDSCLGDSFN